MHPIIEALGLKELPGPETQVLNKILNDNLVTLRAQEMAICFFAQSAIEGMNPLERAALIKRLAPPKPDAQQVRWGVSQSASGDTWFIAAKVPTEELFFTGTPERARTWKFHGEVCPAEIVEEYAHVYKPSPGITDAEYWKNMHQPVPTRHVVEI